MASVKVSFNLPEQVVVAMKKLAEERGTSVTEVIRDSISNEVYLDTQVRKGGSKVLLEKDRKIREIVFPEMMNTSV